ncbi:hypothetical protein GCM10029978_002040 [Actinoallomurus acanthiterrae]
MPVRRITLEAWCWHCPCGARAEHTHRLCRKCQARAAWSRRIMRPRRVRRTARGQHVAVTK